MAGPAPLHLLPRLRVSTRSRLKAAVPPRHEDIVVVNLNPEKRIGMVAKLEIDPFGNRRLRRTGINIAGENPMELPKGAFICGVVIEVKRRTISPYEVENRIKNEYNPVESIEK